jgi:hypothetical protein
MRNRLQYVEVNELTDEFLLCRTLGHAWDNFPAGELNVEMLRTSAGAAALRCTRCHTERYDYLGKDLKIASRRYIYPVRYTTIPGAGTRPVLRGEMLRRSLLFQKYSRNGRQKER